MSAAITVIARCVLCKHEADVTDATDVPMCPKCFSPMVVVRAVSLESVTRRGESE